MQSWRLTNPQVQIWAKQKSGTVFVKLVCRNYTVAELWMAATRFCVDVVRRAGFAEVKRIAWKKMQSCVCRKSFGCLTSCDRHQMSMQDCLASSSFIENQLRIFYLQSARSSAMLLAVICCNLDWNSRLCARHTKDLRSMPITRWRDCQSKLVFLEWFCALHCSLCLTRRACSLRETILWGASL